ncbi:LysR family transcriptional regulator [Rhizobium sp. NPDC090275]|uniref:LysR family transcriptional regulator n=1 Tax=Rhizobium sp. NPDC090275 TaxID=3364498 RepID=UPI00383A9809
MFHLADLAVFALIADVKSISGAARSLKMPKSSVSRALTRLETEVGRVLIERSTRSVCLTKAGEMFYTHACRILDEVSAAEQAIDDMPLGPVTAD